MSAALVLLACVLSLCALLAALDARRRALQVVARMDAFDREERAALRLWVTQLGLPKTSPHP